MGGESKENENLFLKFCFGVANMVEGPVVWFRKTIVEPNRKEYNWYHEKVRRVPTVDQCYDDDPLCKFEADQQFKRDKRVDSEIVSILRQRFEDCLLYEGPDGMKCKPLREEYDQAVTNWFIKYGDLGAYGDSKCALMKQKHRLLWERRHGPVGSGMKQKE